LNGAKGTITRAVVSGHVNDTGIRVAGTLASTTTTADIADSTLDGGFYGVYAYSFNTTAAVTVSVRDSRAVRNIVYGLLGQSTAGAAVNLSASNNMVSGNARGISVAGAGTKVWASGNTVSNNAISGLENGGAVFETAANNAVRNNGANVGTISAVVTQ